MGVGPHVLQHCQPPPSLHMAMSGWNFTQLGWDFLKPPFVFLSIIMFALSWSNGFSSGKLFAAAPLPPTWLTDVWLFWYTGINIAVTDMLSFLHCLSSFLFASQFYSICANAVYKTVRHINCSRLPVCNLTWTSKHKHHYNHMKVWLTLEYRIMLIFGLSFAS